MLEAVFPRASHYDISWAEANSLGENVLYFAESLCNVLPLEPGMRMRGESRWLGQSRL